jgi:hypothetical protein
VQIAAMAEGHQWLNVSARGDATLDRCCNLVFRRHGSVIGE